MASSPLQEPYPKEIISSSNKPFRTLIKKYWPWLIPASPFGLLQLIKSFLRFMFHGLWEDRVMGGTNDYINHHWPAIASYLAPVVKFILDHPMLIFVLFVCSIGGHAYWTNYVKKLKIQALDRAHPKTASETKTSVSPLPIDRPIVYPVKYGERPADRRSGLFLRNDGETAFDVSVEGVSIGTSKLDFWTGIPVLTKENGEVLLETHIQRATGVGTFGTALMAEMAEFGLPDVTMRCRYKDAENRWYVTEFALEREVLTPGGVAVRYISQSLIPPPSVTADLPQRIFDLSKELKKFLKDLGPARQPTFRSDMSHEEFNEVNRDVAIREQRLEAMFIRRYRSRVIDVYNEACELGTIHDVELEKVLSTKIDYDDPVETIIERLNAIALDVIKQQQNQQ